MIGREISRSMKSRERLKETNFAETEMTTKITSVEFYVLQAGDEKCPH